MNATQSMKIPSLAAATVLAIHLMSPVCAQAQLTASGTEFNPAISLILNGQYTSYSNDSDEYKISGFLLEDETGPSEEGLAVDESELVVSANVDHNFYGFLTVALEDGAEGTEVELEEAWFETLSLPSGLIIKGGKFLSGIGRHNAFHPHSWDFADAPLAYQAMLGGGLSDVGLQARWVPATERHIELGAEILRGDSFPASGAANDGVGTYALFATTGGDISASQSWQTGFSYVNYDATDRSAADGTSALSASVDGKLAIAHLVYKWAENGNIRDRNIVVQAEYLHREEDGALALTTGSTTETGTLDSTQKGFYLQGVYQFIPQWRIGLRYDQVSANNKIAGVTTSTVLDEDARNPSRTTVMADYSPSEFSRLRLQFAHDRSMTDTDNRVTVQYLMSLGPHGAHRF